MKVDRLIAAPQRGTAGLAAVCVESPFEVPDSPFTLT
jgi:hypothetical protein